MLIEFVALSSLIGSVQSQVISGLCGHAQQNVLHRYTSTTSVSDFVSGFWIARHIVRGREYGINPPYQNNYRKFIVAVVVLLVSAVLIN